MASREPIMTLPITAAATAFGEGLNLEFELQVSRNGETKVCVHGRPQGSHSSRVLLTFDAYEWARLKKATDEIDELLAKVEAGGATFKIG